ncbi:UDP-glucose dehydrogenase family protein [Cryptosporangium arvum]|uniref:UDP-glucose dehydrogenase family protein n=1 Tax=Cryptosporangium arvum TaxID=80871 RepID=UPI0004AFEC15|nr:UDP-glucose/GDP-mannose dehydrogenase family protein [Cryptosporangium arvum]
MSESIPQRPRLTILGTGYLGATHAVSMAELGYEVLGVDVDESKITKLADGQVPFHEPGLDEMLRRNLATGRLRFTTSYAEAADFGDVHFVCVGTPQKAGSMAADMRYVESAVVSLAPHLTRKALVVGKSTVPVGTAEWVEELVEQHSPEGLGVEVAWNPEFLREGFAVEDTLRPDRLVFGVKSEWAQQMLEATYKGVYELGVAEDREVPTVVTDFPTAELVKVAANSYLATKISFINAMAEVSEVAGADVTQLAKAIGYDVRIGNKFLRAGVGFGGGCLPKDIRAFQARADELGVGHALKFLNEVDQINNRRREKAVSLTAELVGGSVAGARVGVLGATFKPNSDDVRDSPAVAVTRLLAEAGAQVTVYDPQGIDNARRALPSVAYATSAVDAIRDADAVVVLTEWEEFRHADPVALGNLVAHKRVVDGRNCLDPAVWRAAGWEYRGMGRNA